MYGNNKNINYLHAVIAIVIKHAQAYLNFSLEHFKRYCISMNCIFGNF